MKTKNYLLGSIGSILIGVGIVVSLGANFGLDPLSSMYSVVADFTKTNLSIGTLIVSLIMLVVTLVFDKSLIGVGTLLNPILISVSIALTPSFMAPDNPIIRFLVLMTGFTILSFGTSLYLTGDIGTAPYDSTIIIISNKLKQTYGKAKMVLDVLFIAIAVLYFKRIEFATLAAVVVIGVEIDYILSKLKK